MTVPTLRIFTASPRADGCLEVFGRFALLEMLRDAMVEIRARRHPRPAPARKISIGGRSDRAGMILPLAYCGTGAETVAALVRCDEEIADWVTRPLPEDLETLAPCRFRMWRDADGRMRMSGPLADAAQRNLPNTFLWTADSGIVTVPYDQERMAAEAVLMVDKARLPAS